jgi:cytochrome P450
MITNPEVQQKMQEELDRVISSDRLIKVADKPDLPYCNAVVMETQRVANIISLNTLRTTSREVNIAGYVIPKGTVVVPQISVLMADPKVRI